MATKTFLNVSEAKLKEGIEKGTCLDDYKKALENAVTSFTPDKLIHYSGFYKIICVAKISLKDKKALLSALKKSGIPCNTCPLDDDSAIHETLKRQDLPLLIFLLRKLSLKLRTDSHIIRECENLGEDPESNQFSINLLTKVTTTLTIQKAFLRGAIETNNMVLIKFIVEVLKPDLFIRTSQVRSPHGLYSAFARSGDVELLKYFEEHGYNIHECQRELLRQCFNYKTTEMRKYILADQAKSSAADEYTDKLADVAFRNDDVQLLQQFNRITIAVKWKHILELMKQDRDQIFIKTALKRYVEREKQIHDRNGRTWVKAQNGNYIIFTQYHVNQVWRLSKNRKSIWEYFKQLLLTSAANHVITYANAKDGIKNTTPAISEDESSL